MIVLPRYHWLRLLFVWHGSVLPRVMSRLWLVFGLSVVAGLIHHWWISHHAQSTLNISIFTLLGVSLAIFLGFRNSASYDRFWEARKLWGRLYIVSRSLTGKVSAALGKTDDTIQFLETMCALNYVLKGQLRNDDVTQHLLRLLNDAQRAELETSRHRMARLLLWLYQSNQQWLQQQRISDTQWLAINQNLDELSEAIGGCERISTTPIPFTYRVLLNRTVTIYCLLLPLALVNSIGWLTPFIAVFIAYTYLALDCLGDELEEPFGKEGNDLPLSVLCYNIEANMRDMLQQPIKISPPPKQGIYQF